MQWTKLATPNQLKRSHVLGMNERNIRYIGGYNARHRYPLVDNKLLTKEIAEQAGLNAPALIGVIRTQAEVDTIHELVKDYSGFVLKPAQGSGGKGILVITSHTSSEFTKPSGCVLDSNDIERHISNTIAGLFSLGGRSDAVIVERLIQSDPLFDRFSFEGVPDIRVIVFKGYPVMSMVRLSTKASDGKANLHQGAVGVGIDIATGHALQAVQFDEVITHHPDTNTPLAELVIPNWHDILCLAAQAYEMTELGYMGTDIVLDSRHGAQILELNARPGLAIQIANGFGLKQRLQHIEKLRQPFFYPSYEDRVNYAMNTLAHLD